MEFREFLGEKREKYENTINWHRIIRYGMQHDK